MCKVCLVLWNLNFYIFTRKGGVCKLGSSGLRTYSREEVIRKKRENYLHGVVFFIDKKNEISYNADIKKRKDIDKTANIVVKNCIEKLGVVSLWL